MSISTDLERLDEQRPVPPPTLYKYVIPDRVDVLKSASIRFTPPLNTNDIFEVRQTFDLIAGPMLPAFFKEVTPEVDFEESLRNALHEMGLGGLSNEQAKAFVQTFGGGDVDPQRSLPLLRAQLEQELKFRSHCCGNDRQAHAVETKGRTD